MKVYACESTGSLRPLVFQGDSGTLENHYEHPGRLERILLGLEGRTDITLVSNETDDAELTTVHDPLMIRFFREMEATESELRPLFPDSFPESYDHIPQSLRGRFGYYCTDTQTPFIGQYWNDALRSARCALDATEALLSGHKRVFAVCRPPGHHAGPSFFGGFCYLNNTALAAKALSAHGRVAILDIDYHHGNGTQRCFYDTNQVLTVSVHADTRQDYPFFSGDSGEVGEGPGEGFNLNLPVPKDAGRDNWFVAFGNAMDALLNYAPDYLVVAFGADTYKDDPVGGLDLDVSDYRTVGATLGPLDLPILLVQEGGYALDALPDIVSSLLRGFDAE